MTNIKFYNQNKRHVYSTAKSHIFYVDYLDFVQFYKDLLERLKDNMTLAKNKLTNGLNKL